MARSRWSSFVGAVTSFLPQGWPLLPEPDQVKPLLAKPGELTVAEAMVDPSRILTGWTFIPYNPSNLVTRKGLAIFDQMKRDEQVKACLRFKKSAMLASGWEVVSPGDQPDDWEVTQLVRDTLNNFPGGFHQALQKILLSFDYGYSVTEKIYGNPTWAPDKLALVKLNSIKPHFIDFFASVTGELLNIIQRNILGSGGPVEHPVDKFVVYTHDPEFENHYGRSELEAAYRAWWVKDNVYKWFAVFLERHGMAPLFALYNADAYQKEGIDQLKKLVTHIQNATFGLIPRAAKDDLELWSQQLSAQSREIFLSALSRFDADIGHALLVPSLIGATSDAGATGKAQTGSYARSQTHFSLFLTTIDEGQKNLASAAVNQQVIPQLCDLNFPNLTSYPALKFLPFGNELRLDLFTTWAELVAGRVVNQIPDDEAHIRKGLGFPDNDSPAALAQPDPAAIAAAKATATDALAPVPPGGSTLAPAPAEVPLAEQSAEMRAYAEAEDGVWVRLANGEVICVSAAEWSEARGVAA